MKTRLVNFRAQPRELHVLKHATGEATVAGALRAAMRRTLKAKELADIDRRIALLSGELADLTARRAGILRAPSMEMDVLVESH